MFQQFERSKSPNLPKTYQNLRITFNYYFFSVQDELNDTEKGIDNLTTYVQPQDELKTDIVIVTIDK